MYPATPDKPRLPQYPVEAEPTFGVLDRMAADRSYLPSYRSMEDELRYALQQGVSAADIDNKLGHGNAYEFWNVQYIDALCSYIAGRTEELAASEDDPLRLLELGAGNGQLSYFINEGLAAKASGTVAVICTDSQRSQIKQVFPVEAIDCAEAVRKYKPQIVLWSWMPFGEDYTSSIRAEESVQEYILMGEPGYESITGDSWLTWGASYDRNDLPPYVQDGFEQVYLEGLSKLQTSRMRLLNSDGRETSATISFRRNLTSSPLHK